MRLRCEGCARELLVAFSCKLRGICPSCGTRRMAETAAYLIDNILPRVPVRQWVLSFPIPLRSLFAVHPALLTAVLQIIHRVITTFLIRQTGVKRKHAATGAITLIQRFGSAANLNIHLHGLVLDGVYQTTDADTPVFHQGVVEITMRPFARIASFEVHGDRRHSLWIKHVHVVVTTLYLA